MKRWIMFFLGIVLLSTSVFSVGLALSPTKVYNEIIGQNFSIHIQVINQEDIPGQYRLLFEGSLADRAKADPGYLNINPAKPPYEDGISPAVISINSTGLTPGEYDLKIVVELKKSGDNGGFSVVQQVTRTIHVNYGYPPSVLNKILNFGITNLKSAWKYVIDKIKEFYQNNLWINYLFLILILTVFFYVGTKAEKIRKDVNKTKKVFTKEKKKLKRQGFSKWFSLKIKDSFKKLKRENKDKKEDEIQFKDSSD